MANVVRFAFRRLRRRKGFLALAAGALGLGLAGSALALIAVRTATRTLAVLPDAPLLYWIGERNGPREDGTSLDAVERWRRASRMLTSVTGFTERDMILSGAPGATLVTAALVSWPFFDVIGVRPAIGRAFTGIDDTRGAAPVVVISDRMWFRAFGGARDVLERALVLNGRHYAVVGVMPPGFAFPSGEIDAWVPASLEFGIYASTEGQRSVWALGRSRSPVSPRRLADELQRIVDASSGRESRDTPAGVFAEPLITHRTHAVAPRLRLLLVASLAVLLVGCGSVGNLLLGELLQRRGELSLRRVLGSSRRDLIALVAAESSLIVFLGALAGVVIAAGVSAFVGRLASSALPELRTLAVGARTAGVIGLLAALIGISFGVLGYAFVTERRLSESLRNDRDSGTSRRDRQARGALVASSAALAVVLVLGAGMIAKSYINLSRQRMGFDARDVWIARVMQPIVVFTSPEWPRVQRVSDQLLDGLRATRAFQSVAISSETPGAGNRMTTWLRVDDATDSIRVGVQIVSEEYFDVLRLELRGGRTFLETDRDGSPAVAVVDERIIAAMRGPSLIGHSVQLYDLARWASVVGVVGSSRQGGPTEEGLPQVFLPYRQLPLPWGTVLARTPASGDRVRAAIASAVPATTADRAISDVRPLAAALASRLDQSRFYSILLVGLAVTAVALTAISLYGSMALAVAQRRREIGVRMSIGASPSRVGLEIMRQGLTSILIGTIAGLALALPGARILAALLYGASPMDPWVIAGSVSCIVVTSLVALLVPALRAAALSPSEALRA